jgi:hypothetical protein
MEGRMAGLLLLIHPETGDVVSIKPGDGALARALILDGYNPIGPKGLAAAAAIRAANAPSFREHRELVPSERQPDASDMQAIA